MFQDILRTMDGITEKDGEVPEFSFDKKKKKALFELSHLNAALAGSVGWAIQTGIPLKQALNRTYDVDAVPLVNTPKLITEISETDLDKADMISPGWEKRV